VNFSRFEAATHISRVNCGEIKWDRPRQPANEIFSIKHGYPFKTRELCCCWPI